MNRKRFIPADYTFDIYKPIESLKKINLTIALYNIGGYIATQFGTNYIGASFVLLGTEHSIFIWKETYGGPIFCGIILYLVMRFAFGDISVQKEKKQ